MSSFDTTKYIVSSSLKDAITKAKNKTGIKNLVIRDTTVKPARFSLYMIFDRGSATDISYKCKKIGTSERVLADDPPLKITTDYGFKDMVSTIHALSKMPVSTPNPVYYTGNIDTVNQKQEKLFIAAMLLRSLAHSSPKEDRNETEQGVFSNYMQFSESVVNNWDSIGNAAAGFDRLEKIHNHILGINKGDLIDPVYVMNSGTLAEYGKIQSERKNYAFYEGYSRLNLELLYWQYASKQYRDSLSKADTSKTGVGVMFRVSDNVELYEANLADTFNMFKTPFISGDSTHRRVIVTSKNKLLRKIGSDGLWVKGRDETKGEQQYYTGVAAVRLPMQCVAGA